MGVGGGGGGGGWGGGDHNVIHVATRPKSPVFRAFLPLCTTWVFSAFFCGFFVQHTAQGFWMFLEQDMASFVAPGLSLSALVGTEVVLIVLSCATPSALSAAATRTYCNLQYCPFQNVQVFHVWRPSGAQGPCSLYSKS